MYLKKGLEITYIHTIVQFHQSAIYREYIDTNTLKRSEAKDDFTKSFYKQINNSLFGKSMEGVRARMSVKFLTNAADYQHEVLNPRFLNATILRKILS